MNFFRRAPLPWRPGVARFACDVTVEGEEWPYCPRTILRRQLERAAALGYEFRIGAELEVGHRPGNGTRVRMTLPLAATEAREAPPVLAGEAAASAE